MLSIKNLTKYYGQHKGLSSLSFSLSSGDVLGILGPNGSGKTTLFRMLLGLIPKSSGEIIFNENASRSTFFGYLPEERSVYRDISVIQQISYLARLKKMNRETIRKETQYWLTRFNLLEQKDQMIKSLSKGNQQKVQFICALIHKPEVLILDEPLTGLDASNVTLFKDIIFEQSQKGRIILLSSHQYEELETFCNQIVLLKKGETILKGNLAQLKQADGRVNVILDQDEELQYRNMNGVLTARTMGNYSHYMFKDRLSAQAVLASVSSSTLRIEPISLRQLVQEAS